MLKTKILFILILVLVAHQSFARCLIAERQEQVGLIAMAREGYESCSNTFNDPTAQMILGTMYLKGKGPVEQNLRLSLFYFRLAAESGYAPAQRELAKLMRSMLRLGEAGIAALQDQEQRFIEQGTPTQILTSASNPMPSLSWIMLAADKAEDKWFYPAPAIQDAEAVSLMKSWESQMGADKVTQARQRAIAWKENRLFRTAKRLLSSEEYDTFQTAMYPGNKKATMTKPEALNYLKQVWVKQQEQ